jgi:hypothetical protein
VLNKDIEIDISIKPGSGNSILPVVLINIIFSPDIIKIKI